MHTVLHFVSVTHNLVLAIIREEQLQSYSFSLTCCIGAGLNILYFPLLSVMELVCYQIVWKMHLQTLFIHVAFSVIVL